MVLTAGSMSTEGKKRVQADGMLTSRWLQCKSLSLISTVYSYLHPSKFHLHHVSCHILAPTEGNYDRVPLTYVRNY